MGELRLIEAAKAGHLEAIETLIANGEDLEQTDEYGWTALNWAAGKGHSGIIQKLLAAGSNIAHTGRDQRSAYQIALAAAQVESAALLQQAEINAKLATCPSQAYCKAYPLKALRKFPAWHDHAVDLTDETVVFLHQDFSVTRSIWHGEDTVFADLSSEWASFCQEELAFAVPTELAQAARFAANRPVELQQAAL